MVCSDIARSSERMMGGIGKVKETNTEKENKAETIICSLLKNVSNFENQPKRETLDSTVYEKQRLHV